MVQRHTVRATAFGHTLWITLTGQWTSNAPAMASLLEWQVILTAAITKTARKHHSTTKILRFIRGKSLRHFAMLAKNSGSQQNRGLANMAEQNEKKDWHDLCEFPVHDFVTQDQNGSPLFFHLSSFDNVNGFLWKERLRSRNFPTMVTWRHTSTFSLQVLNAQSRKMQRFNFINTVDKTNSLSVFHSLTDVAPQLH